MDLTQFANTVLDNKLFIAIAAAIGGMFLTILGQQILNRRGLLTYFVLHNRVGLSTDDAIFGSVRITWNNNPIQNLYFSTVELINQSMRDYENVVVRVFTNDTSLLTERTEIVGTTRVLNWTEDFARQLRVEPGQQASQSQIDLHSRQRHYLLPVLNRGQVIRFQFLNAAVNLNQPSIWLDILHRGVRLQFRVRPNEFFGVAQPTAACVGIILGLIFIIILIAFVQTAWIVALLSLFFGLFAIVPGAYTVKACRWLRNAISG